MKHQPTATQGALKGLANLIAVVVIMGVTGLGDIMYLQLMISHFPVGLLLVFCYVGAFASFLAMGYLLIGKTNVFRPGGQMIAAWVLLFVELIMAALNMILVFTGTNHTTGFLSIWLDVAPATPVAVMFGVVIVFFLDPNLQRKHEDMETEDRIHAQEREFILLQAEADMKIRKETLKLTEQFLIEELQHPDNLDVVRGNAARMFAQMMSGFTGFNLAPRRHIVEGSAQKPKETPSQDVPTPPPTQDKPSINGYSPEWIEAAKAFFSRNPQPGDEKPPMGFLPNVQYTHNKVPTKPWGGKRRGAGRKST